MIHHCIGKWSIPHQILTHWFTCWRPTLGLAYWRCPKHSKMLGYTWVWSTPSSWEWFARIACTCCCHAPINCVAEWIFRQWILPMCATMPSKRDHIDCGNIRQSQGKKSKKNDPPITFKWKISCSFFVYIFCRRIINFFLCLTQLGFCCIYFVFVAANLQEVVEHYYVKLDIRIFLLLLLIPMILLNFLKNLKYLVPVSLFASALTTTGDDLISFTVHISNWFIFFRYRNHILLLISRFTKYNNSKLDVFVGSIAALFRHCHVCIRRSWSCTSFGK